MLTRYVLYRNVYPVQGGLLKMMIDTLQMEQ